MRRAIIIWIRNQFGFSRTEISIYLIVLFLMLVAHFAPMLFQPSRPFELAESTMFDSISQILASDTSAPGDTKVPLSAFNPNLIAYDSLIHMGVSSGLASNIVRYREAGGKYRQASDMLKLYNMTDSMWRLLLPVISIPELHENQTGQLQSSKIAAFRKSKPDINHVDSLWLKRIYGIGPVLSKRIIKYRELLGGYHSLDQLTEVYGLSPEVVARIRGEVLPIPDQQAIIKLDMNRADRTKIAAHPYFSFKQAESMVAYRAQHGLFNTIEEIKKIHLIDDSTYLRVSPYLDF